MPAAIATRGLTKSYGRLTAVEPLDLELEPGVVLGFLGPNGAGKTTLIRMVTTILRPTAGSFEVAGMPDSRPEAIRTDRPAESSCATTPGSTGSPGRPREPRQTGC
jgi:ABC-2 type transport system ATP-binding protein